MVTVGNHEFYGWKWTADGKLSQVHGQMGVDGETHLVYLPICGQKGIS